ncbi:DNA-binding transcriptional regulator, HxlR family [Actinokineospora alba]|uniref:DNA-binding transcriptional regulator, HxlR family n=1 Tax=Actinokineospora alba TaxID=504798 RepID=A0A1H0W777_9PSEU|nr:helix-turn-helix domain-containing protein [Actinokineospora alba]TDP70017.1 HxlR family transcriptional regulator [Actinokineospora alba]SDJ49823.1 DNA-binding transcriptional regulator, HxlR family [Actinokineospora alba]SDP86413.1 DNA-binding transcriptional regulator, HxlR family [Actinokineospora alba]
MTDNQWKLVVDREGVTIASDRFRLTAAGAVPAPDEAVIEAMESSQLDGIISELQSMTRRTYGQFCGLSRAVEMIGERWALLIIRDLLVGPKSFTDLAEGFPRLSIDVLCARLREMEHFGVVEETMKDGDMTYELTAYGRALDEVVLALSRWGALSLEDPRPEDIITENSVIMALRSTYQAEAAAGLTASFELRLDQITIHAKVVDGVLKTGAGSLPDADLVVELGPALKMLMSGEMTPAQAIEAGHVGLTGDASLFPRFVSLFQITPVPVPVS